MRLQVQLNRGTDNQLIDGVIVELAQNHIDDFENLWREQLRVFQAEDKFWDWLFKLGYISNNENEEGYALEAEGCTQGLMMVEIQLHGSLLGYWTAISIYSVRHLSSVELWL